MTEMFLMIFVSFMLGVLYSDEFFQFIYEWGKANIENNDENEEPETQEDDQ